MQGAGDLEVWGRKRGRRAGTSLRGRLPGLFLRLDSARSLGNLGSQRSRPQVLTIADPETVPVVHRRSEGDGRRRQRGGGRASAHRGGLLSGNRPDCRGTGPEEAAGTSTEEGRADHDLSPSGAHVPALPSAGSPSARQDGGPPPGPGFQNRPWGRKSGDAQPLTCRTRRR